MVADNADVVFNYELAKMYAVILCDSEVILSLSLRHLVKQSRGHWLQWPCRWVSGTAILIAGSRSPVSLTKYRWIKYK